ncbi:MAG: polysaccharide biosynthesis tyrosine autokinase [Bdellovibrionales bacterium]|nr:polysaccharide biosynthesis tyrosine autokinase [Bdellovibrionales bacterium]
MSSSEAYPVGHPLSRRGDSTLSPAMVRPLPNFLPGAELYGWDDSDSSGRGDSILRDYWGIVVRYRTLIVGVFLATTLIFTIAAFLITPLYVGKSRIRIGTYEPVLTAASVEGVFEEQSKEANYLETQIQEVSSFTMADRVLNKSAVRDRIFSEVAAHQGFFASLFGGSPTSPEEPSKDLEVHSIYTQPVDLIEQYLTNLSVRPVRRTSLVEIQFQSENPVTAALIANEHAKEYRDWVRESRVEQRSSTLRFLREQGEDLREKVMDLEREIADYAEENSIVAVNADQNITAQRMSQLNQLLTEVTAKRIEAEKIYEKSKDSLSSDAAGFDDDTTRRMRGELATLKAEYSELLEKFTPEYPKLKQIKAKISGLNEAIQEQRSQIVEGLQAKSHALELEEARLQEELDQQKSKTFELAKRQVHFNVLNRELESSRELLQNVLRQTKESALAIEGNSSNVTIVDFAVVPDSPSYPKKSLLILGGMGFGAALGVALAFLFSHLDNTIRTAEALTQLTYVPNLGVVPSFEKDQEFQKDHESQKNLGGNSNVPPQIALENKQSKKSSSSQSDEALPVSYDPSVTFIDEPRSLASEAYRSIRTAILLSQAGEPPRVLAVTSAQSSEGKTTSVINIAASLASTGDVRVLVIDCDLRRPSVMSYLGGGTQTSGVVEVLTGLSPVDELILPDILPGVSVLPSGRIPPNPAELIGSKEMRNLLASLSDQFDFIVIDTPPVLPVTDSVVLSRLVDGVIFVVKGGTTPRRIIADAKDRLVSVGARILGTILNDVNFSSGDYYYYNKYYLSYYQEDDTNLHSGQANSRKRRGSRSGKGNNDIRGQDGAQAAVG